MNRPIEGSDYNDLKQQVEALRKRIGEMECRQVRFRVARNRAFPVLLVIGGILLTIGVLGAQSVEALFVSKSGNVGIRTSDPKATLDVAGNLSVSSDSTLKGKVLINGGNAAGRDTNPDFPLSFSNALGDKISLFGLKQAKGDKHYGFGIRDRLLQIHTPEEESDIAFGYGSSASFTETMRIKGDGNVIIASKDPKTLQVKGDIKLGAEGNMYAPAASENLRMVRGTVDAKGKTLAGTGFSVDRPEKGKFEIKFSPGFSGLPSASATQIAERTNSEPLDNALLGPITANSIVVYTGHYTSRVDHDFSFVVMGPR